MQYMNQTFTINNSSTTSTQAIKAAFNFSMSAQAVFSDNTAAGALKIQASDDTTAAPTNWSDVPSTSQTVASGATTLIPATTLSYKWVRVTFVSTGGAGTIAISVETAGQLG